MYIPLTLLLASNGLQVKYQQIDFHTYIQGIYKRVICVTVQVE